MTDRSSLLLPIHYGSFTILPMRAFSGILWSVSISEKESWTDTDLGRLLERINHYRSSWNQ